MLLLVKGKGRILRPKLRKHKIPGMKASGEPECQDGLTDMGGLRDLRRTLRVPLVTQATATVQGRPCDRPVDARLVSRQW